jgi:hypothetical protein
MSERLTPLQELEQEYIVRRNELFKQPEFREALKPLDDVRTSNQKKRITLQTIDAELKSGHLAADQAPKLKATLRKQAADDVEAAAKVTQARVDALPRTLEARVFATPSRGPETAEAKSDLRMGLDHAEDIAVAVRSKLDAAIATGDGLTVRLLASDWGRDYIATRTGPETADAVHGEVRVKAAKAADLFPSAVRDDLARMGDVGKVKEAYMAGLSLLDMERQNIDKPEDG